MGRVRLLLIFVLSITWVAVNPTNALAAYSAHQNDQDINNFLAVYPYAKSTKLDDCALCHKPGKIGSRTYGSCDYCHRIYKTQPPHGNILETLNSYGLAYNGAGRTQTALKEIEGLNSDGDASTNIGEIQALTFPGDSSDYPGLIPAPAIGMNLERLLKLPSHSQFLFLNASNSRDFYARYRGVKMIDLLKHAGLSKNATQITVYSPDGFSQTFLIDVPDPQTNPQSVQYDVMGSYPYGTFYGGLDFVDYGVIPGCINDGDRIPDVKLTFSLLSLGNVSEANTSSGGGHFKKWNQSGKFQIDLPAGEYTVVASKEGCTFAPASLSISLPDSECDFDGNHWDPWDHQERWKHCNRHPENQIEIIGSCAP